MADAKDRQRAVEAVRALNHLVGDLLAGWYGYAILNRPESLGDSPHELQRAFSRMSLSWLALSLAKWAELYDHYKSIVPPDCVEACRKLRKDLHTVDLMRFRSKMVAHVLEDATRRPLTPSEMNAHLERVVGKQVGQFLHLIKRLDGTTDPERRASIVDVVEVTRDRLIAVYELSSAEIFEPSESDAA